MSDSPIPELHLLTEPVDGKWDKIVLYHQPNGEESTEGMSPVLEGSLR